MPILSDIERNGVLIDSKKLNRLSKELEKELNEIQKKCFKITKREFNLNSPKQLQEMWKTLEDYFSEVREIQAQTKKKIDAKNKLQKAA